jgi:hypothetical protein
MLFQSGKQYLLEYNHLYFEFDLSISSGEKFLSESRGQACRHMYVCVFGGAATLNGKV